MVEQQENRTLESYGDQGILKIGKISAENQTLQNDTQLRIIG